MDSTLLQHLWKRRHFPIKLPQFNVVAVRKLLGKYDGLIIIGAVQVDRILYMVVASGAVAELVGIEGGVVSGVINLESSGVEASDWRPRHDEQYHEA